MKNKSLIILTGVVIAFLIVAHLTVFIFSRETMHFLAKEDSVYEMIGAVSFLCAAILFFITFFKNPKGNDFYIVKPRRNIFFLLLALLFLFGFGEEISWGQRLFNIDTPEELKEANVQGEINLHNLTIFHGMTDEGERKSFWGLLLNMDRLFSLFWFTYCFLIPILNKFWAGFSTWLARLNLPIVPIPLGVLFLLNYLVSVAIVRSMDETMVQALTEIKECGFAVLFAAIAIWFFIELRKKPAEPVVA